MKRKNEWILGVFFCSMFLLQIWVAQAQNNNKLPDYSPLAIKAMYKVFYDPQLGSQLGFKRKELSSNINNNGRQGGRPEKADQDKNFIWYNPWTWFN